MLRLALKLAAAPGAKVTAMLHVPPAATLPQLLVWLKLLAFVPPMLMLLTESEAAPVFVTVMLCAALVVPAVAVKLSELTLSETDGVPADEPPLLDELPELQPKSSSAPARAAAKGSRRRAIGGVNTKVSSLNLFLN